MYKTEIHTNWNMRRAGETETIPATVPGSVYGDLLADGKMEDPFWKDNEVEATKLMDYDYEYETSFDCPDEIIGCDEVILRFEGLDTIADIRFNGCLIGHTENMHRTFEFSVGNLVKPSDNELKVYFHSPNKYIAEAFEKAPTLGTEDAMNGFVHT